VVDTLTSKAGMADRTNFTPETTSPERTNAINLRRKFSKITKSAFILPLITVFLQVLFLQYP
jgi:hypothetical protein